MKSFLIEMMQVVIVGNDALDSEFWDGGPLDYFMIKVLTLRDWKFQFECGCVYTHVCACVGVGVPKLSNAAVSNVCIKKKMKNVAEALGNHSQALLIVWFGMEWYLREQP